jgi:hypothetical protein
MSQGRDFFHRRPRRERTFIAGIAVASKHLP